MKEFYLPAIIGFVCALMSFAIWQQTVFNLFHVPLEVLLPALNPFFLLAAMFAEKNHEHAIAWAFVSCFLTSAFFGIAFWSFAHRKVRVLYRTIWYMLMLMYVMNIIFMYYIEYWA